MSIATTPTIVTMKSTATAKTLCVCAKSVNNGNNVVNVSYILFVSYLASVCLSLATLFLLRVIACCRVFSVALARNSMFGELLLLRSAAGIEKNRTQRERFEKREAISLSSSSASCPPLV